ncbi:MAG: glycosyltransferase family 1 protein [Pseudomonadota bacterium]
MKRRLLINGRFLEGARTAVNDVAFSLTTQLVKESGGWDITVVLPESARPEKPVPDWPIQRFGLGRGIGWEQVSLPSLRHDGVTIGFFNTVPLRGRGYVTMLHDTHVFDAPESYANSVALWRRLLSRRAGRSDNKLLTVSNHAKESLLRQGIGRAADIGVVPNGPGHASHAPPDAKVLSSLKLARGSPFCLAQASLLPHKNLQVLLRAFAQPELSDMRLVLFGGVNTVALRAAGFEVRENVICAGRVSDSALAALYTAALAVCVPSKAEGFGLPALEAMALGTPLIISPCGALPEVAGKAALIAQPDDPSAWCSAINMLANDTRLHARLVAAGRAQAECFTWQKAGAAVLNHLDRWYAG